MIKRGVWGSVPVEYARVQTDFPGREGWNHGWTRN
jgi:large subunit ribosomal protein L40